MKGIVFTELLEMVEDTFGPETADRIILASDLHRFPQDPEKAYEGKKVRARGEVRLYKGRPEMVVRTPEDITIVP